MCLAVPGKITALDADAATATVNMLGVEQRASTGVEQRASTRLIPTAQVGDYVLVHAGFGIQIVSAEEAEETLKLVADLTELVEDELPAADPEVVGEPEPAADGAR